MKVKQNAEYAALINRIEFLITERKTGFPIDPATITDLEYVGLCEWTACEMDYKRNAMMKLMTLAR